MGFIKHNSNVNSAPAPEKCNLSDAVLLNRNSLLVDYPNLSEIDDPIWEQVIREARIMKIPKNTEVYNESTRCNSFILLLDGNVRVYYPGHDGREITMYRVVPGDLCVLSLMSMLNDRQYNVVAKTEVEVSAMAITEAQFRDVMDKSEQFRNYVMSTLSERLCDLMCLVQDTVFQNLHVRIACALDKMFRCTNSFKINTTHQSLAHEIGTTREVISRILKEFEKEQYIKISRGTIEITSYDDIHRLAHPTFC